MDCPVCSNSKFSTLYERVRDYEYDTPEEYKLIRCHSCELVRVSPIPTQDQLKAAYPDDYHSYNDSRGVLLTFLIDISVKLKARFIANRSLRILDIGCGSGYQLASWKKHNQNISIFGIEYNDYAASKAKENGVEVLGKSINCLEETQEKFDVIILNHVLEHIIDIKGDLSIVYDKLSSCGKLMGEVPNFGSTERKLFKKYWGGNHIPRHIWHFNQKNLKEFLITVGFKDIKISPVMHTSHLVLSIQNTLRNVININLKFGRMKLYPFLLILFIPLGLIEMVLSDTGVIKFEANRNR